MDWRTVLFELLLVRGLGKQTSLLTHSRGAAANWGLARASNIQLSTKASWLALN